ncbi:MAG TPA: ABC transporter permease, partial [Parafilimonas sp.]
MFKNYFKTAWRNLAKNKFSSFINIGGLAAGMTVALLISLWIYDELSFDKNHENYKRIVQVMANSNVSDGIATQSVLPVPLSAELKNKYGSDFKYVASALPSQQSIAYGDNAFLQTGYYAEPDFTNIITLQMLEGTTAALQNPGSVLLNASTAKAIFGNKEPLNKLIVLNGSSTFKVAGVYKDMPQNTEFNDMNFIAPVASLFTKSSDMNDWYSNAFNVYALLNTSGNATAISSKIKNVLYEHSKDASKPSLFLYPMQQWHLYEFKNGQLA